MSCFSFTRLKICCTDEQKRRFISAESEAVVFNPRFKSQPPEEAATAEKNDGSCRTSCRSKRATNERKQVKFKGQ